MKNKKANFFGVMLELKKVQLILFQNYANLYQGLQRLLLADSAWRVTSIGDWKRLSGNQQG